MKNEVSPVLLNLIASVVVVLAAIGGFGYWYYTTTAVEKPVVAETEYPTAVLNQFTGEGVLAKTKDLKAPGGGQVVAATPIPVGAGELGKTNLGSLE